MFKDMPVNPHPRMTKEFYAWEQEHADEVRAVFQHNLAFAQARNAAECREQGITGRPTIKPDGKPLTQNERNHRHQRKLKSDALDAAPVHAPEEHDTPSDGVSPEPRKRGRPAINGRPLTNAEKAKRYRLKHKPPVDHMADPANLAFVVNALKKERDQLKSENAALKAKLYDMNAILSMTS